MVKIIYILGTGYCGSTVLEMCLGAHKQIINVGEIDRVLVRNTKKSLDAIYNGEIYTGENNKCSCNEDMYNCEHWGEFYKILLNNLDKSFEEKYLLHYKFCQEKYSDEIVIIDSSKGLNTLKKLNSLISKDLVLPLLLVKDIRNWTTSVQKKHQGSAIKRYIRWYIEHKKFIDFLDTIDNYMTIGYEEFALFPASVLKMICSHINLNYDNAMLIPNNNTGHSVLSNRMRYNKNKKSQIFYDYRWFTNTSLPIASLLFPFIMKMNKKLVYSNKIIENRMGY